jgi:hypothetical protein
MRDYSERRQSRMVAPKKRPSVLPYVLIILILILFSFGAGFGTGWYLYRPGGKFYKVPQSPQPVAVPKQHSVVPPQGQPIAPAKAPVEGQPVQEKGSGAPPLTFYKTLQKGNKELMGTGINQPKVQQQKQVNPTSTPPPER